MKSTRWRRCDCVIVMAVPVKLFSRRTIPRLCRIIQMASWWILVPLVGVTVATATVVMVVAAAAAARIAAGVLDECPADYSTHPLILVSLDGFHSDYISRGLTPTLVSLGARGVRAPYMKPSYPSKTFPNHYTIVTGLYPESHGILDNDFADPVFNATFSTGNTESFQGRWWGGEPIWNTLTRQGKISATYFWPGSDVDIGGQHPTYWFPYDKDVPYPDRVDQVLEWVSLPVEERPAWISLYYNMPDKVAHHFGPDSKEVNDKLVILDQMLERLLNGLDIRGLRSCVNVVVLSDHGTAASDWITSVIKLADYVPDIASTATVFTGAFSRIRPLNDSHEVKMAMMKELSCQRKEMRVYPREGLPTRFHFSNNRRIEDIVLDLDPGFVATISFPYTKNGHHGYDNYFHEMNALFVASGPDFKTKMEVEPFQNIELYNLMCYLTGVEPSANNGTLGSLYHILANPPPAPQLPTEYKPPTSVYPERDITPRLRMSGCPGDLHVPEPWLVSLKLNEEERNKTEMLHLPWGIPHSSPLPASLTLLHHQDHVTGYSQTLKMPLWSSFSLQEAPLKDLTSQWCSDVRLTTTTTPTCGAYAHLAARNISMYPLFPPGFSWNASLPRLPFLVSNAVPASKQLIYRWEALLQELVPAWLALYGPLNLVLGPVFDNNADSLPDDFHNFTIPEVPSHLFSVVTRCKTKVTSLDLCSPSDLDAAAFIIPMVEFISNCQSNADYLAEFSAKVHDVELVTGLTFFPDLDFQTRTSLVLRMIPRLWPLH
ncbi:venom phosphodiesterase isoform X1 [Procambarus clarkii]|uniref:venom phosphodiesterase isoform X1 n=1 Tax=Procambarus clarkii TaxID=6728 RepID=UPI003743E6F0